MRWFPMLALFCGAAFAQNTDLGILGGVSGPVSEVVSGTAAHVSTSVGGHVQFNLAFQLKEYKTGRLYLELPFLWGGDTRTIVGPGVSTSSEGNLIFTPGIRWNLPIHSRLSLYGTAGAGPIGSRREIASVTGTTVTKFDQYRVSLAGGIGGGIDVRLARLISLRGEARDFISTTGFQGGSTSHHYVVFGFGFGFHW
jgi:hypothetical protein